MILEVVSKHSKRYNSLIWKKRQATTVASVLAQQGKMTAANPEFSLGTHMIEGENQLHELFSDLHVLINKCNKILFSGMNI